MTEARIAPGHKPARDTEERTGACKLAWEDETEELIRCWLAERNPPPSRAGTMGSKGGSKGKAGPGKDNRQRDKRAAKIERLRGPFRARNDDDRKRLVKILRHEAPFLDLPTREDGWVFRLTTWPDV